MSGRASAHFHRGAFFDLGREERFRGRRRRRLPRRRIGRGPFIHFGPGGPALPPFRSTARQDRRRRYLTQVRRAQNIFSRDRVHLGRRPRDATFRDDGIRQLHTRVNHGRGVRLLEDRVARVEAATNAARAGAAAAFLANRIRDRAEQRARPDPSITPFDDRIDLDMVKAAQDVEMARLAALLDTPARVVERPNYEALRAEMKKFNAEADRRANRVPYHIWLARKERDKRPYTDEYRKEVEERKMDDLVRDAEWRAEMKKKRKYVDRDGFVPEFTWNPKPKVDALGNKIDYSMTPNEVFRASLKLQEAFDTARGYDVNRRRLMLARKRELWRNKDAAAKVVTGAIRQFIDKGLKYNQSKNKMQID